MNDEGRHVLYVGWIMAQFAHRGFLVRLIGVNRLHLMPPDDTSICFEIDVPKPPKEWP